MAKPIVPSPKPASAGFVRAFGRGSHFQKISPKLEPAKPTPVAPPAFATLNLSRNVPAAPPSHPRQSRSRVLLRSIAKQPAAAATDRSAKNGSAVISSLPVLLILVGLGLVILTR